MQEHLPQEPLTVRIDQNRLKQVILNLVINAQEAMPEGGRLGIRAREKSGQVELLVSDTGKGIPESDIKRVFEPFYSKRRAGCGLGLAISKRFVEEAGGSISVGSTPEGAAFTVILPTTAISRPSQ